jgi:hypothetical protein
LFKPESEQNYAMPARSRLSHKKIHHVQNTSLCRQVRFSGERRQRLYRDRTEITLSIHCQLEKAT